jgi:mannose/fructose-specific phosphotransferase system component IIA
VVTHGGLGRAILDVVEGFLGPQEGITVVSNRGLSAQDLRTRVEHELAERGDEELFVFTDLDGGSCGNACAALARERSGCYCISGVNLPMLVEFCHYRERLSGDRLLERVTRKGRDGVIVTGGGAT